MIAMIAMIVIPQTQQLTIIINEVTCSLWLLEAQYSYNYEPHTKAFGNYDSYQLLTSF